VLIEPWLSRAARAHPQRVALRTPTQSLSYAELAVRARSAAAWLSERGVGPQTQVALALPGGAGFAAVLHGALALGAVVAPVDPRLGPRERATVIAGAAVVVEAPIEAQAGLVSQPAEPEPEAGAGAGARIKHDLASTAVVMHTSGTSGTPKAVALSYANLLWSALGSAVALGLDPGERWLCALPVAHVGGLSILLRSAIYATTAIVLERFDTEAVLDELHRVDGPTLISLVPTTLARLLDAGLQRPATLRCALIGGGPVAPVLLQRARAAGVRVSETYGLTEACSQVTTAAPGEGGADAGAPLFCTRVGISADGEILVSGPTVAAGARGPDGWLSTGDLGALDTTGRLTVTGRKADTIVSGGENVAPTEVEAVLLEHPGVSEAAVCGRPDSEWGEAVVAIVVPVAGAGVGIAELRDHCAARLARFKVPKDFVFDTELPRTPSGKLLRRALHVG